MSFFSCNIFFKGPWPALNLAGFVGRRPRAIGEYGPSEGEEFAKKLEEMDVHCNPHPSHNRCNHRRRCAQAMAEQEWGLAFTPER